MIEEVRDMTLQEYADSIYNDPSQGSLYKEQIVIDLDNYKKTLNDLLARKIKPSTVIGTGYINPRKVAIEWLEKVIAEYQSIVDGTTIHSVVKVNYEFHTQTRRRMLNETNTP